MQSITLQTSDTVVTSGDKLGQLNFAASAESDGSAAILIAGSVYVQAEGSFQSASNPTSIVFATAAADASAAADRLKINHEGHLLPLSTETYDLGSNSSKFRNTYANSGEYQYLNVENYITASGERVVSSETIHHIKQLTQAEYDAITPDSATFYIITDAAEDAAVSGYFEARIDQIDLDLSYISGIAVYASGAAGGSSYTAGSGLTLVGSEFNVYGGSGNFKGIELTASDQVPVINFLGSGAQDTPINMEVRSSFQSATGSGTALLFQGTQGQLFSITDNLSSGTIFNVSDITGLPMLEITASGDVEIGEFADSVTIHQPVLISGGVPTSTTNKLYNNAGTLYFNGSALGGGISNVVEDTTPQLGGTLDANGNTIDMGTYTITDTKVGQWDTAYGWGDHSSAGYLTSQTSHADVVVDGDFGSQGIMLRGASAGSYSILTDNSSNWNTAYGWGDHSSQGYVTSLTDLSVTSTAAELNLLDGVTATTTEINYIDGVTSNIQTQLDAKAAIASPTFTGTPAAPTAAAGTNTTQIATTAYVTTAISNLVDGAPTALDTLNELAAALNDDASAATTLTNLITSTSGNLQGQINTKLENIVEDTTPQLGGTLDANGNSIDMGTNTITDTKVGQWDTAYGWGNHASAGYSTTDTTYTAGSGLTLVGTEFNTAGTGNFTQIIFDDRMQIGENSYSAISGTSIGKYAGSGYLPYDVYVDFSSYGVPLENYKVDDNIFVGKGAGSNSQAGKTIAIGFNALTNSKPKIDNPTNFFLGPLMVSGLEDCIAIGEYSLSEMNYINTTGTSHYNRIIGIGSKSYNQASGVTNNSCGLGYGTFLKSVEVAGSVAIGPYAGTEASGGNNLFLGYSAGTKASGVRNIYIGRDAGSRNFGGSRNIELTTQNSSLFYNLSSNNSDKININNTIVGDTSSKLLAIGNVTSSDLTPDATLEIKPNATTDVGLIVQAVASHSASLQEWQNSSETKLLAVGPDGGIEFPNNTPSTTTNKLYSNGTNLKFGSQYIIDSSNVNTGLQYQPLAGGLNVVGLTVSEFATSAIVTEAEGISSNDNDTTLPTSAAVKDYVDNNAGSSYTAGSGLTLVGTEFNTAGSGNFERLFTITNDKVLQIQSVSTDDVSYGPTGVFIGGGNDSSGVQNTYLGYYAANRVIGEKNVFVGYATKTSTGSPKSNETTGIGYRAFAAGVYILESTEKAVGIGSHACFAASGSNSIGIGYRSLYVNLGDRNIEIVHDGTNSPLSYLNNGGVVNADKLHIGYTILGDTADKKLAIGNVGLSNIDPDATLEILPKSATDTGLIVQGATSQSATLQEWQNSSETKLLAVGPDGGLEIPSNVPSTTTNKFYNNGGTLYFNGSPVNTDTTYTAGLGLLFDSGEFLLDDPINLSELDESTDAIDDKILLWDESASTWKYMTLDNLQDSIDTTVTPGGSDTYIQFNDGGSFGGDADLVWNKTTNALTITGSLNATTKSFLIDHPSKPGMKLQYASLEGPENGVYVRGTTDSGTITLPDYWRDLVHNGSITVTLTPVGQFQPLFVEQKSNREIRVGGVCGYYDYVVYGERKDVDKLEVEW